MKTKLIIILVNIILFIDKLFSKKFLYKVFEKFQETSYIKKYILGKNLIFFTPNYVSRWRVETFNLQEPETLDWINSFDDSKKIIFWDIGANIGLYSMYASLKHKNIEVISFEPSTNNLRILSRNISINNLEDIIKINQFPLSDKINCYEIMRESEFIEGYSMSSYSYQNDFEGKLISSKNKYRIFGTTIDYLIKNNILEIPDYIKIDVDGIEHKILTGAEQILSNNKIKSILIEINENFLEQYNSILNILSKNKFDLKFKKKSEFNFNKQFDKTFNYVFEKKN